METLYYGGDIITMEQENEEVEAVLVRDGKIQQKGSKLELEAQASEGVQRIDLEGKTLMPSFIDPHGHISFVGPVEQMANLSECTNFKEIQETLETYMTENHHDSNSPVIGFGYDPTRLEEQQHPTKEILNAVSTESPIFILHASGHMGCGNDRILDLAGIGQDTPDEDGGTIGRIEGSREPNGYLEEGAMKPVQKTFSGRNLDYFKIAKQGQDVYIRNGITTVQDGASSRQTVQLFQALAQEEKLQIDVVSYPTMEGGGRDIMKENPDFAKVYQNRFKIGGYKIFLDGSPQGKTAWLTEPYEGEESYRGYPWYTDEQVKAYTTEAIEDGAQLLTHCNGDAAADQLLTSYEKALEASDRSDKNDLRPVMIHCQTVRNDQLDQMARIRMIPSIFMAHTYYWGDVHLKNLGDQRGRRISPARSALDRGLCVNFHQDPPVLKPDMLHTIWCAVNRQTRSGASIGPEERVSVYEALQAVTINAAYQYREEDEKGSITEGKLADLVVLDQNPLKVDPFSIRDIQVLETIKEGESIYRV
ncbi:MULTISPECIES: amidohydrolase [Pontibacillus]|uniref:Amidohydrolase n=1 Tax=Pontibacillus chungwhensis TaxID=265426 RepID=A0ABY8UXK4_9BACI|nr:MULTISPECIES: amidohydrolase [Pontibacillus]MCD5324206.1 amidohydrolase [Pontibacillus sp. HN14]WIF97737.1 amidohydrolase [Pontibacillus chungwhensis]